MYNLPKFFELRSEVLYEDEATNTTNVENESVLQDNNSSYFEKGIVSNYTTPEPTIIIVGTEIRRNPWYIIIYVFWSKFLLVEIVPYLLMIVMNILIWRKIQEFAKIRRDALGIDEGKQTSIMKWMYNGKQIEQLLEWFKILSSNHFLFQIPLRKLEYLYPLLLYLSSVRALL